MKHIVSISPTSSAFNMDQRFTFKGEEFRLSHFGTDFDTEILTSLLNHFDGFADVIALQGIHPPVLLEKKIYYHSKSEELKNRIKSSLLVCGEVFRKNYIPWAINYFAKNNPNFFSHKKIAIYSGIIDLSIAESLSKHNTKMSFLDPYIHLNIRKELNGIQSLRNYMQWVAPFLVKTPLDVGVRNHSSHFKKSIFSNADIYVSRATLLERLSLDHLIGKTLILDTTTPQLIRQLTQLGVEKVVQLLPEIPDFIPYLPTNFSTLEAIIQCKKLNGEKLNDDDVLNFIQDNDLSPQLKILSQKNTHQKKIFAFIVHPLSINDIVKHPAVSLLKPVTKKIERYLEKTASLAPGVLYGKMTGIRSIYSHDEVEGLIYCLFDTPRMLMSKSPEKTYLKAIRICKKAADAGAGIIGLGAYTKVVGDAGVTIAQNSPIPVTTGNALSASATLWAAREACQKMGFIAQNEKGKALQAKVMIIGATGSIGAVCAKMLSSVFSDLVLCSRSSHKLLDLKKEIELISPRCSVKVVTQPNHDAESCDLIVTSTSSLDKKVLDIMKVKPGCVICDVSRPLDIIREDAIKRPDILVIESGEIELPGQYNVTCDLGTPDHAVYACLAETALLALEGRFESFTLSRHVSYSKVKEIYKIARKHGAKLGAIRGHNGIITDAEIELCRAHAIRALGKQKNQSLEKKMGRGDSSP